MGDILWSLGLLVGGYGIIMGGQSVFVKRRGDLAVARHMVEISIAALAAGDAFLAIGKIFDLLSRK